jgi:N-methylhydantoinase A
MLAADVIKDYTLTVMLPGTTPVSDLSSRLDILAERGRREILDEGVQAGRIHIERFLDMRYLGQSYELIVPFSGTVYTDFHRQHKGQYGYSNETAPVEVVNLRARAIGQGDPPPLTPQPLKGSDPTPAFLESRPVVFSTGTLMTNFYLGESLENGNILHGPAVVVRSDTTILLGATDKAEVDQFNNLRIRVGA